MGRIVFFLLLGTSFAIAAVGVGAPTGRTQIQGAFFLAALVIGLPWWVLDAKRRRARARR